MAEIHNGGKSNRFFTKIIKNFNYFFISRDYYGFVVNVVAFNINILGS